MNLLLSAFPCVCHSLPLRLPLTSLPLTPLLLSSPILPSALFTPTLPLHQRRAVLNRNSLIVSVDLSWWQPQTTTECIFIPYGGVLSFSLYPQPQFLLIFPRHNFLPFCFSVILGAKTIHMSSVPYSFSIHSLCIQFHVFCQIVLFYYLCSCLSSYLFSLLFSIHWSQIKVF